MPRRLLSLPLTTRPVTRKLAGLVTLGAVALTTLATACGDAPTSPASRPTAVNGAPNASLLGSTLGTVLSTVTSLLTPAQGLLRTTPLAQPVVVVKTLPSSGGSISVPGTDFELQVPAGAFEGTSMTFTITAYAGSVVAYDFQPHGVKFLKPLKGVQRLGGTNWTNVTLLLGLHPNWAGAYFADSTQLNLTTGLALINEFMPGGVNVSNATMTWDIPHFSGYMISTGRE